MENDTDEINELADSLMEEEFEEGKLAQLVELLGDVKTVSPSWIL